VNFYKLKYKLSIRMQSSGNIEDTMSNEQQESQT
jgi:hypothetical protein